MMTDVYNCNQIHACVQVGTAGSIPLLELIDMERPFTELKALDMDEVTDRILDSLDRKKRVI